MKSRFGATGSDGNHHLFISLQDKFLVCKKETKVNVRIIDNSTNFIVSTNDFYYEAYCEAD